MKRLREFTNIGLALSLLVVPGILQAHSLLVCKASDTQNPVTGSFHFEVTGDLTASFDLAVGGDCHTFLDIGPKTVTIAETAVADVEVTSIVVSNGTGTVDLASGTVTGVMITGEADVTVTFTNATVQVQGKGRWTGGGSINPTTERVTHGFELHCSVNALPNNLEVNWGPPQNTNRFHLDALTSVSCGTQPITCSGGASVPFIQATGLGSFNGVSGATITFLFSDAGEPGKDNDFASYLIGSGGTTVLDASGCLDSGNQQFHKSNK